MVGRPRQTTGKALNSLQGSLPPFPMQWTSNRPFLHCRLNTQTAHPAVPNVRTPKPATYPSQAFLWYLFFHLFSLFSYLLSSLFSPSLSLISALFFLYSFAHSLYSFLFSLLSLSSPFSLSLLLHSFFTLNTVSVLIAKGSQLPLNLFCISPTTNDHTSGQKWTHSPED
ncbi:hypothetical protein I7I53_09847 [Histoplasma capsulatum var. duboisii H88]|uniref:Uncharacterized protein n=1 Tax=Ajellomyces capsulatus (strain H88) TaxID=544711 RepID=A0A8A1LAK9_AJEC8|nr:hypothetical protein I7I53_09847 [Histoplasma capsulatum var. duboisii H88]